MQGEGSGMWCKRAAVAVAGVGWGVALVQAAPILPEVVSDAGMLVVLAVAICATIYVAMKCQQRPIAQAYELGYEMGRRDAIRAANQRPVSTLPRMAHERPRARRSRRALIEV